MTDIAVHQASKHFGLVRAVQDLTFEVPAGKITGFLGPNGAGKTTTLRMVLGLVARPCRRGGGVAGVDRGRRDERELAVRRRCAVAAVCRG